MINLFYPLLGSLLIFCMVVIGYKLFTKKSTKYILIVGCCFSILYFISMLPNLMMSYKDIEDNSNKKCLLTINKIYDEFNSLNRYNPTFIIPLNILKPNKCEDIDYCYWNSPTFNLFKKCMSNKEFIGHEYKHLNKNNANQNKIHSNESQ